jgi:two-component system LytT family sensor kinase
MMEFTVSYLTLQALGFAVGTTLCWLFAALQWKATNRNGGRGLQTALPLVGSVWTCGSFAMQIVLLAGLPMQSAPFGWSYLFAWTSTFLMPSMWLYLRDRTSGRQPRFRRTVLTLSILSAIGLTASFVATIFVSGFPFQPGQITKFSAYNAILHALLILLMYRWDRSSASATSFVKAFMPLICLQALIIILLIHAPLSHGTMLILAFASQQSVIPNVILAASFVAKFRYADVLLKRSLNVMLSVTVATLAVWWMPGIPRGIPVVIASLSGAALLLASPALHRGVSWIVDRGFLRRPQYEVLARSFAEHSDRVANSAELFALAEKTLREALHVESVRVVPGAEIGAAIAGENIRVTAPHADYVLLVSPTPGGRRLLAEESVFMHAIGREVSRRLEALEFERERNERQRQQERLQHSLTEAELKALRAQVDPHFLFNTLNTVADLITSDPAKAEIMTERLAEFFRYTLTRTDRTLATLDEELQFVRHYLHIEQVRFGDRLSVELSTGPGVAGEMVPALILQPLVENAIRHGLAPKPEGGRICVSASREGGFVRLRVADDGVGMRGESVRANGIGLRNVRERLQALYGDAARMDIDSSAAQGTSVSLLLPANT